MTDPELLAIIRAHRPPASTYAVVVAARTHHRAADIAEATGYSRSAIHQALRWLDHHTPDWRDGTTVDLDRASEALTAALTPSELPAIAESAIPESGIETPGQASGTDLVLDGMAPPAPRPRRAPAKRDTGPALWRAYSNELAARISGRKSWDLYHDVYSPTADRLFAEGQIDDLVALVADYLLAITGEELTTPERKRVGQLVRKHGKAALHGLNEAAGRTENPDVGNLVRYATAVCTNTTTKLRQEREQADSCP